MALRKFLYMDPNEGFSSEQAATDELELGKLSLSGIAGIGLNLGASRIANLADPTSPQDAATKNYVDTFQQGVTWKQSVRVATDSALPAATYSNGAAGNGATLTANANGALTVDGTLVAVGDRVLVKDQAAGLQNGVYVVTQAGDATHPFILTRALDADDDSEVVAGLAVFSGEGAQNNDMAFVLTTNSPISLGTTELSFVQFTGLGQIVAGSGLTRVGNTVSVKKGDGIEISSNGSATNIDLDSNPGLALNGTSPNRRLAFLPDASRGLAKDAAGAYIELPASNPGLHFDSSGNLDTLLAPDGGLAHSAAGDRVKIDNTTFPVPQPTIATTSDGLKVVNAPKFGGVVPISGPVSKGDALYIAGAYAWSKGDASDETKARITGVAAEDGAGGFVPLVGGGVVSGVLSGATPGTPYYLGTNGQPVPLSSVGGGSRVIRLGYAVSATDLDVYLFDYGKKAA